MTDVGHLTEDDVADAAGEDKMQKALESKEGAQFANVWDLARHYTEALLADWQALGLREPDVRPRATEHVREQIEAVAALIASGHAYETSDGVYFHVPSFPAYGQLSGNTDAEALVVDARGTVQDGEKRDPRDFALWKKDDAHLMQWFSPFAEGTTGGWGFPGWHLECSVMAQKYLGETIDLHGGGEDLRFPHHECEIAQAEALSGKPFSRYWVHTRFLQVEGEKMSKSKGNFLTVHELIAPPDDGGRADWGAPVDPLALRLVLISGHYARPFNLTRKALDDAAKNVKRFAEALDAAEAASGDGPDVLSEALVAAGDDMLAAMADDLNTPIAIAAALRGANAVLAAARSEPLSARLRPCRRRIPGPRASAARNRPERGAGRARRDIRRRPRGAGRGAPRRARRGAGCQRLAPRRRPPRRTRRPRRRRDGHTGGPDMGATQRVTLAAAAWSCDASARRINRATTPDQTTGRTFLRSSFPFPDALRRVRLLLPRRWPQADARPSPGGGHGDERPRGRPAAPRRPQRGRARAAVRPARARRDGVLRAAEAQERLGHLDMARVAAMDAEAFQAVFAETPAVHRFTSSMAARTQEVARHLDAAGGGGALWETGTAAEVEMRIQALPGFGPLKAKKLAHCLFYFGHRDLSEA